MVALSMGGAVATKTKLAPRLRNSNLDHPLMQNSMKLAAYRCYSYGLRTESELDLRVGHSVLFRSVRSGLLRSKKRTLRSFPFFLKFFATYETPKERYVLFRSFLKNGKEQEKRNVLLQRTEKNGKNVTFFCKERKRTARTFRSFAKRTGERYVLFSSVTFFFRSCKYNLIS